MSADAASESTYDYEILLEIEEPSAATEDALYDSHDVLISSHGEVTRIVATVPAPEARSAALHLLDQVAAAGATSNRFVPDLVTRAEIAARANVSRQAVSNWTRGERKTAFPRALSSIAGGLWCYGDVVPWLTRNLANFSEPCRHLTWSEFSEIAPLVNKILVAPPPFPGGAISQILESSQTNAPTALANQIWALIQHAASGGTGQRDPVNDLLESIAQDASVGQRSVIVDTLPMLLQAVPNVLTDPYLEARTVSLSMYFANSLGNLATERDRIRIEKAIRAILNIAITRKEVPKVSAILASLAFSPYQAPIGLISQAVDLVGVPAYADAFLAMLATNSEAAVGWLLRREDDHTESGIATQEAIGVLKYAVVLMSTSRPRHAALPPRHDRKSAIDSLLIPLLTSLDQEREVVNEFVTTVGSASSVAASIDTEEDSTVLDSDEYDQVEQLARYTGVQFEHWPPIPAK